METETGTENDRTGIETGYGSFRTHAKILILEVQFYYSRISSSPKGTISRRVPVLGTRGPSQVTRVLNFASTKQGVLVQTVQQL
jgi:hypothetical protein